MSNDKGQPDEPKGEPDQEQAFGELRHYVPAEILNVSFPAAVRGYDRRAVDAHIKRVNRLIAEIKAGASPRAAVRHALEQTEQQVSGLLERARETADEITTSAHREAETEADGIRAKAADLLVNANAEAEATKTEAEKLLADSKAEAETVLANARAEAEDLLTRSRVPNARPMSAFSSYRPSLPLCGIRPRRGCASSRPTPPRFGRTVVNCSSRCAAWRKSSSIWPMRLPTGSPT